MHEISGPTAVNNHFVDGSSTQSGTVVTADWLNTVQDEVCNLITSVGIPLNSEGNDDKKQLIAAITKIIGNAVVNFVTQTDLTNLSNKVSTLATQSDLSALAARVTTCEQQIQSIIGKVKML